jgi:hypothetical protein
MAAKVALMLAWPNGAGKTTTATTLFRERLRSIPFNPGAGGRSGSNAKREVTPGKPGAI